MSARLRTVSLFTLASLAVSVSARAADVSVERATTHQTIDGFGFFGAHDVWWGSASDMVNEEWVRLVIEDLGLTVWRNEYYPPADGISGQDADWAKQRPVVELFQQIATERSVPLKVLVTVWSPPAAMKCKVADGAILDGVPHPEGTKSGGALCPSQRQAFADWLVEGLELYAAAGVDVYGLSLQNEPYFSQTYNSCFYDQAWYAETLAAIGPTLDAAFPEVKLFGAENMLEIECGATDAGRFDPWWYTGTLLEHPSGLAQLDAWAVHGYSDGVAATPTSKMATLWSELEGAVRSTGKPIWMTETSGYADAWEPASLPGAIDLAQGIYAALRFGNASAWVWWQGSALGSTNEYVLMSGTGERGKRYYVSKNFYRFVRPGAQRVETVSDDGEVLVTAFEHTGMGALTVVAINVGTEPKPLVLTGAGLPADYVAHRTSASEDCVEVGSVAADAIVLPPRSVTTLVNGNVYEDRVPGGTGGTVNTGGATSGGATTGGIGATGGALPASGGASTGGASTGGASTGGASTGGDSTGGTSTVGDSTGGTSTVGDSTGGTSTGGALTGGALTGGASSGGASTGGLATGGAGGAGGGTSRSDADGDDSGCGCATVGSGRTTPAWALLLVAGLVGVRRRRRRAA